MSTEDSESYILRTNRQAGSVPELPGASEAPSFWDLNQCARWMKQDLQEARALQALLLPGKATSTDGLAIAAGFRPMHEVSGDLYDLFERGDGRLFLIFGDASGRGAAVVWGLLRILVTAGHQPAQLLQALNEALLQRRVDGRCMSLLVLSWDGRNRRLALANAGATPPIICRKGEILDVDVGGVPLGLWANWECEETSIQMEPQDLVLSEDRAEGGACLGPSPRSGF